MDSLQVLDHLVAVKPGEPYRLLPFGTIVKNGKRHELTPEYAAKFRLPHFRPPVKLGSHDDTTPAGGHIIGLEVREDGLYAIPELNDNGTAALSQGHYRYHSPEILWEGAFEDPTTGEAIQGPLIVGDALLHTPHLGERAALYSVSNHDLGASNMAENETVTAPVSFFERLLGRHQEQPEQPTPVTPEPDKYQAEIDKFKAERDELAAKVEQMESAQAKAGRIADIATTLTNADRFGVTFSEGANEAAAILEGMTDAQRDWVLQQFAALAGQVKESNLVDEIGNSGKPGDDNPVQAFNAAVTAVSQERKIDYAAAAQVVATEQPELFAAYKGAK